MSQQYNSSLLSSKELYNLNCADNSDNPCTLSVKLSASYWILFRTTFVQNKETQVVLQTT